MIELCLCAAFIEKWHLLELNLCAAFLGDRHMLELYLCVVSLDDQRTLVNVPSLLTARAYGTNFRTL